ncbi:thiamine phosphate synthase [Parapedobacter koreensis]|uniref:Thiamine-phosphate pyrophosphorylase n=1 Tax=Parapedobacter koreensis TaxID=332977 RepID=A0A1H7SR70_9SPHI|nr:thiamine phosphate synthase [Parapedobacter koreensis]SEL74606.1 thiamine-phosphate pyrophosphorylase [Parapedobacter koreensis]
MQLSVITREDFFKGEADALNDLFEAGLTGLHLRKPHASRYEMRALLRRIDSCFHKCIIMHSHITLFDEFDLLGVHLPLGILLEKGGMQNKGQISCSAHTQAEVEAAAQVADRTFISPVFDSISKKGYAGNVSLLTIPRPEGNTLWVALGGVTPEHLPTVYRHGFKAAAVMGYIWEAGRSRQRFEACQAAVADLPLASSAC